MFLHEVKPSAVWSLYLLVFVRIVLLKALHITVKNMMIKERRYVVSFLCYMYVSHAFSFILYNCTQPNEFHNLRLVHKLSNYIQLLHKKFEFYFIIHRMFFYLCGIKSITIPKSILPFILESRFKIFVILFACYRNLRLFRNHWRITLIILI